MYGFLSFFALRTVVILISTAFSLAAIMLALNIITTDDLISILGIDPNSPQAIALRQVISRFQEVTGNVMSIISKLVNHLFSWAGVDANVDNIKIDVPTTPIAEPVAAPAASGAPATN
jgi:hypothetical protein